MKTKTKIIIDNPTHPTTNPTKVEQIPISNNKTLEYHKANGNIIFVVFSNETVNPDSEKMFSLSIEASILQEQINDYFKDEPIEFEFNTSFSPIGIFVKEFNIKGVIIHQYKKLEDCEDYECGDYYFYVNTTLILKFDMSDFESMVSSFEMDSGLDTATVIKDILIPHIPDSLKTAVVECKEIIEVNTPKTVEEPAIGQKKANFKGDWKLKPKHNKSFILIPTSVIVRDNKTHSLTFLRFAYTLSLVPVFDENYKVIKKTNVLKEMFKLKNRLPINITKDFSCWDIYESLKSSHDKVYIRDLFLTSKVDIKKDKLQSPLFKPNCSFVKIYSDIITDYKLSILDVIYKSLLRDYEFKSISKCIKFYEQKFNTTLTRQSKTHHKNVIQQFWG